MGKWDSRAQSEVDTEIQPIKTPVGYRWEGIKMGDREIEELGRRSFRFWGSDEEKEEREMGIAVKPQ